jgi:ATP-dependent Clp protease ATP-binding subunit ClpC
VVLLDEMEKAHPDVFHILLQVLDEGQLTDSLGRRVDFKNTIVIMTSNIGTRQLSEFGSGIGFETSTKRTTRNDQVKSILQKALQKTFAPEFLNRIDDVVMFNQLSREDIDKIIDIELKGLYDRIETLGYRMKLSAQARDFIADRGFDVQYGARPLKRAIQKYLEDPLAEVIIKATVTAGATINVGYSKGKEELSFKVAGKKDVGEPTKESNPEE